jgi:hypothetical protein
MPRKRIEHQADSGSLLRTFNLDLIRTQYDRLDGIRALIDLIKWQSTISRELMAPKDTVRHSARGTS